MPHVLFVDANEGAFSTIERALARGYDVSLIESHEGVVYQRDDPFIAHVRSLVPRTMQISSTTSTDLLRQAVGELHKVAPIDALIAPLEDSVETAAIVAEALAIRFTNRSAVSISRHKNQARSVLDQQGLKSARYCVCQTVEEAVAGALRIGLPLVIKPVSGTDSFFASLATSFAEVEFAAQQVLRAPSLVGANLAQQFSRGLILEEYLSGDLLSVELAAWDGNYLPIMLSGRSQARSNPCIEMGAVLPAPVRDDGIVRECYEYAVSVCKAVGLDIGVFHIELVMTSDGPALVEINPRLMGGVMAQMYQLVTSTSVADLVLDIHFGITSDATRAATSGVCTGRKILPAHDGEIPPGAAEKIARIVAAQNLYYKNYKLHDGGAARRHQALGRIIAHCSDYASATRQADRAIRDIERVLRIDLEKARTDDRPPGRSVS